MPMKLPPKPKRGAKQAGEGVIYARYSSHSQKDISIEQQVEQDSILASDYGIRIIETYADRAISGRTDNRPAFQKLMRDAAKGKFRYVIAWKSNRIGRNMLEALINETKLNDLGVRLLYVEEDFDDSAAGRFAARSMMNVNQFYSENLAEDVRRGMQSNASNCMVTNGLLPFGYKADENLRYAIDEPKDEIVREIFLRVASGETYVDIYTDLNRRGIRTALGREWGRSSFRTLIRNERYRGIYIYEDTRIEGGIPRIVSDELFFKVQEVLKVKKSTKGRHSVNGDYLLTGKLRCGECGDHMVGVSGTGKSGKTHYYYACKGKLAKKCKKQNVRRDDIEENVAKAIRDYVLQKETMNWIADVVIKFQKENQDDPELDIMQSRLADVNVSLKNIMAAIERGIFTATTKERLEELEAEQKQLSTDIKLFTSMHTELTREQVLHWLETFKVGDIEDKKVQADLFNTFLSAVYLYDDGRCKVVFGMGGPSEQSVDIKLIEASEGALESSYKLSLGVP